MPACVRVLGIDPGFGAVGYGVVEMRSSRIDLVSYGAIRTEPQEPIPDRLLKIHDRLEELYSSFALMNLPSKNFFLQKCHDGDSGERGEGLYFLQ